MCRLLNALIQEVGRGVLLPPQDKLNPPPSLHPKKSDANSRGARMERMELPPKGVQAAPPTTTSGGPECNGVGSTATYPQMMLSKVDLSSIQRDYELTKYALEGNETLAGLSLKFSCRVEELKRLNGMASVTTGACSLVAYKTIWVPLRPPSAAASAGPHAPDSDAPAQASLHEPPKDAPHLDADTLQ